MAEKYIVLFHETDELNFFTIRIINNRNAVDLKSLVDTYFHLQKIQC